MDLVGDEFSGIDLVGDEALLGAVRRKWRGADSGSQKRRAALALIRATTTKMPGVQAHGARDWPLPFPALAFTATSGTSLTTTSRPQRPFRGARLSVDIARTGASATGLVTITAFNVGQGNQFIAQGALPANGFSPTAVNAEMNLDSAQPGIDVVIAFNISVAPAAADRVDLAVMILGLSVG
jgi:hypothetical protein